VVERGRVENGRDPMYNQTGSRHGPKRKEVTDMRKDGTRVKDMTPITQMIPYIMPKRYDAMNWASDYIDEDAIRSFLRKQRKAGRHLTHMSVLMAAYYKAALENPRINCFVMNRRIYQRNHFCVSFVILKNRADGTPDETTLKVFLVPEDDVFTISEKIRSTIEKNLDSQHNNSTDKAANFFLAVPGLAYLGVGLITFLDRHQLLPRFLIDLSPFHTSLFITNLASIKTGFIFHHCYEFGTTSVFLCMGKPERDPVAAAAGVRKKRMPMSVVMDERIATGVEYSRFFAAFQRYLHEPEVLAEHMDTPYDCVKERIRASAAENESEGEETGGYEE